MNVLIVEDELVHQRLLLRFMGEVANCEIAHNGVEALKLFEQHLKKQKMYDLIFLDIMMPDMDGLSTLKRIRYLEHQLGIPQEKRVKIIMTTALGDKGTVLKAVTQGCNNYLIKPFSRKELFQKVEEVGFKIPKLPHRK